MYSVDTISKILDVNNGFNILTYFDFNDILTKEFLNDYVNTIIKNNTYLISNVFEEKLESELFNMDEYLTIYYENKDNFNSYIYKIINEDLIHSFKMIAYIDNDNINSRIYFIIKHSYTDGYKLINMLLCHITQPKLPNFKRTTDKFKQIYHYIVGTIMILILNIKFIMNLDLNFVSDNENKDTDYIICKSLNLQKIKKICKKKNISINDFLYALMIKTDKLYTKKDRLLKICSPINVSNTREMNNMCPVFNIIENYINDEDMLSKIHHIFDNYKYSCYIPIISYIINYILNNINIDITSYLYNLITNNCDYIFSNIIAPSPLDEFNYKNIHFLTKHNFNCITFNSISSENYINIIYSFKKGLIIDKLFYEKCLYKAYHKLLAIDNINMYK